MEEKNQREANVPFRIKGSLQTLKLNKEFKRAYYQGKSKATPYFICYRVKNRGMGLRYGLTTSKKSGECRLPQPCPPASSGGDPLGGRKTRKQLGLRLRSKGTDPDRQVLSGRCSRQRLSQRV